jgi:DNA polymerase-3 subunit epsilon
VRPLAELDVLVVDCQTTGASPTFGVVLELAWGVARADRAAFAPESHLIALPDGHVVPEQVVRMTGYDPANSANAIVDRDAWRRLREATANAASAPTAIHYARFELAFLRDWAARFEPEIAFPLDAVCVHALARRLYPDLPRQSLRALAGFLGHGLDLTRSSLSHVEATAFVWRKLCAELAARQIETWEALQAWLSARAAPISRSKKPKYPIDKARYKTLPDEPGVYRFLRSNGDILYVGKATSLRTRTASHFSSRTSKQLQPEMLTQVSDIRVTVVASALEAALLEHDTITALRPPYNVQLIPKDARIGYAARDFRSASERADEAHPIGPLPSAYSLAVLGAQIELLSGANPSPALRGTAVGVSDLWTPNEAVFAEGWGLYLARRSPLAHTTQSARQRVLETAKELLLARVLSKAGEEQPAEGEEKSSDWDPERVARHLERAAAQAYQVYRRASWLRLLHDSDVVYREPESERTRLLRVRNGELHDARDFASSDFASSETPLDEPLRIRRAPQMIAFDRVKYDRLRILATELKRIQRDGGHVAIYLGRRRPIPAALCSAIQRIV